MPLLILSVIATVALKTEVGAYGTHSFLISLYSRKRSEEVLDNFIRGQLFGHISENPGLSFTELKERINRPNGTVVFHLKALERDGLIKSFRHGLHRLFFPAGLKIPEGFFDMVDPEKVIFKLVKSRPGISQKELSDRTGMPPTTVNRHIHNMRERGLISVERGRNTRCFVIEN